MRRLSRSLRRFVALSTLAVTAGSTPAAAGPTDARLVRTLDVTGLRHPLADESGRIPVLAKLPPNKRGSDYGMLELAPGIASLRAPPPVIEALSLMYPELDLSSGPGLRTQLDRAAAWNGAVDFSNATEGLGTGKGVVVGIVDTGIDIKHPAFRRADGTTRIAYLITWGQPRGVHRELEQAYGCTDPMQSACAVYSGAELNLMLDNLQEIPDDVHDVVGHGTHVASIAAGNGLSGTSAAARFVGVAPEATLIIGAPSRGGGFGDDEVLRATRFIFDRATEIGAPAVVNLSLGGDFGPHDGSSALESGLAALVGDNNIGRSIVVAAGNSGGLFRAGDISPLGIHTEAAVYPYAPVRVPLLLPGAKGGNVFVYITYRAEDELSVGLEGPDGVWIPTVDRGDDRGYEDGPNSAGIVNDNPNKSTSITENSDAAVVVWSGEWQENGEFALLLEGRGLAKLWVASSGLPDGAYFQQATKNGTINTPSSHPRLLSVGCTLNRDRWVPLGGALLQIQSFGPADEALVDSLCYFSAGGPNAKGVMKPEIVAPGAFVAAAMSEDADPRMVSDSMFDGPSCPENQACYVVDERYALAAGTSMSAPMVSGAVALMFQQRPDLTHAQVTEVLQASARKLSGDDRPSSLTGAGALDLRNALAVLADEESSAGSVAAAASYWTLSSESARPDFREPLTGLVQLRRADGSVASGLGGSELSVHVEGGRLLSAPVKVRHGLFEFAVAAPPGSGGTNMRVSVSYEGQPVGTTRVIPIGVDVFATDDFEVDGGCTCSVATPTGHGPEQQGGARLGGTLVVGAWLLMRRLRR